MAAASGCHVTGSVGGAAVLSVVKEGSYVRSDLWQISWNSVPGFFLSGLIFIIFMFSGLIGLSHNEASKYYREALGAENRRQRRSTEEIRPHSAITYSVWK